MATMRNVAEYAGVSTATVSHVINGTRYVSPELTGRVLTAMRALNYQPDAVARSLRRRETLTIGLIIPSTEIPFFAAVAHSIEAAAFQAGYNVILCNSGWNLPRELRYLGNLLARRVDGLVCISLEMTADQIAPVVAEGTPVVMFERRMPGIGLDAVGIDNVQGATAAMTHLLELRHRRIGCIRGLGTSSLSGMRLEAYRQVLAEWGVAYDPALVCQGDYLPHSGRMAARALMDLDDPPTAIFALNDMMAIGALQVLHERDLRVPGDVAVVGFDGIPLTQYTSPALTTVVQPISEMGRVAVELLLARIRGDGPREAQFVVVEPELVVRASTVGAAASLPAPRTARQPTEVSS
ncbi:MAG: LacI family transcriptional regulator [Ardenticatenaceae bacterium]|nr:LacI family transcriptional regulator [Ardenticatenaceae bacterium]